MKTSIFALIAALGLSQVNASPLPGASSDFHVIQETPIGPIYSNLAPKSGRSESKTYIVGGDAKHHVYSNIDPAQAAKGEIGRRTPEPQPDFIERRDISQADIDGWVKEHPESGTTAEKMREYMKTHPDIVKELQQRDLAVTTEQQESGLIEKRDWEDCTACYGVCVLAYAATTNWRSWHRILGECAALCLAQRSCTTAENGQYHRLHWNDQDNVPIQPNPIHPRPA